MALYTHVKFVIKEFNEVICFEPMLQDTIWIGSANLRLVLDFVSEVPADLDYSLREMQKKLKIINIFSQNLILKCEVWEYMIQSMLFLYQMI